MQKNIGLYIIIFFLVAALVISGLWITNLFGANNTVRSELEQLRTDIGSLTTINTELAKLSDDLRAENIRLISSLGSSLSISNSLRDTNSQFATEVERLRENIIQLKRENNIARSIVEELAKRCTDY